MTLKEKIKEKIAERVFSDKKSFLKDLCIFVYLCHALWVIYKWDKESYGELFGKQDS